MLRAHNRPASLSVHCRRARFELRRDLFAALVSLSSLKTSTRALSNVAARTLPPRPSLTQKSEQSGRTSGGTPRYRRRSRWFDCVPFFALGPLRWAGTTARRTAADGGRGGGEAAEPRERHEGPQESRALPKAERDHARYLD